MDSAELKRTTRIVATLSLAFLAVPAGSATGKPDEAGQADGKALLESRCGRCHAIEAAGKSPLRSAPPLRHVYRRYPIEQLAFELSEGMGSRHKGMPQIQFSTEQVEQILDYLNSIAD